VQFLTLIWFVTKANQFACQTAADFDSTRNGRVCAVSLYQFVRYLNKYRRNLQILASDSDAERFTKIPVQFQGLLSHLGGSTQHGRSMEERAQRSRSVSQKLPRISAFHAAAHPAELASSHRPHAENLRRATRCRLDELSPVPAGPGSSGVPRM